MGIEGATIGGEGVAENKVTGRDGIATFSLPRGDYIVILEKKLGENTSDGPPI